MDRDRTVGVSGADGFIGQHLCEQIRASPGFSLRECSREIFEGDSLASFLVDCDVFIHLAGLNRGDEDEIYRTNVGLAEEVITALEAESSTPHVVFISSTQRENNSAYGRSKREGERRFQEWAVQSGAALTVLVVPNVFGPGCPPFYHSVVATFSHQLARGEQPEILEDRELELLDVGSLAREISGAAERLSEGCEIRWVEETGRVTTGELLDILESFRRDFFDRNLVPDLSSPLRSALYGTFLSHIEPAQHCHEPEAKGDERGQLFEIIRTENGGQFIFSTTKPGVTRGDHYHRRKIEWFCVVKGRGTIRMRKVGGDEVSEFAVNGETPQFLSIPPLYTHHIENTGEEDLLTLFWCNETYNEEDPDTFYEQVDRS